MGWADENVLVCVFVDYVLTLEISGRFVGDANRRHLRFRRACPGRSEQLAATPKTTTNSVLPVWACPGGSNETSLRKTLLPTGASPTESGLAC